MLIVNEIPQKSDVYNKNSKSFSVLLEHLVQKIRNMRDSLELFEKTLEDYVNTKGVQAHLMDLVENLYKDLETERSSTTLLQQKIQELTQQDLFGITSKHEALKADYAALKQRLVQLKNENDDLNIQLIAKTQESKQNLSEKEEQMKIYYMNQMKQKDEELQKKEQLVETFKDHYKQKEQSLYAEVQAAEVSSAIELNRVEEEFRKQLQDYNQKYKDSMETCNNLRIELMSLKEQLNENKRSSNEKIAELQKRLRNSNAIIENIQEAPVEDSIFEDTTKYQALKINKNHFVQDKPVNLKKPVPVYRSSFNNSIPPLINLKETNRTPIKDYTNNKTPTIKKRKLYNPDDLTHLNNFEPN